MRRDPLVVHGELLKQLSAELMRTATANGDWDELFYDIRYEDDVALKRLVIRDGDSRKLLPVRLEGHEIQTKLWQLKKKVPNDNWYGLFVRIDRHGHCKVEYNYDPNCMSTFAEDELSRRPF